MDKNPQTTDENMEQLNDEKAVDEVFITQSMDEETERIGAVEIQTSIQGGWEHWSRIYFTSLGYKVKNHQQ